MHVCGQSHGLIPFPVPIAQQHNNTRHVLAMTYAYISQAPILGNKGQSLLSNFSR